MNKQEEDKRTPKRGHPEEKLEKETEKSQEKKEKEIVQKKGFWKNKEKSE